MAFEGANTTMFSSADCDELGTGRQLAPLGPAAPGKLRRRRAYEVRRRFEDAFPAKLSVGVGASGYAGVVGERGLAAFGGFGLWFPAH